MTQPKVSVIVPVYNVAKFLPQCLDSLAAQTLKDIEVVLVNDGSTDGSGEILRAYAARCPTFRLIEQENKGYSGARNTALEQVTGDYIGFVDADDWVEPQMFESLLRLAQENDADIAQGSFSWFMDQDDRTEAKDNSWIPPMLRRSGGFLRGAEAILFEDIAIWKKIYRRSLIEARHLRFDESMPMGEDVPFHLITLCLARKIAADNVPYYHYRKQRPGQQTLISDARLFAYFKIFTIMNEFLVREHLEYLRPWMLHLQLSRHCWGYEMAAPEIKGEYFRRFHEALLSEGVTEDSKIPPGNCRYGKLSSILRWLLLRMLHPLSMRAVLRNDRKAFDRLVSFRVLLQDPVGALRRIAKSTES